MRIPRKVDVECPYCTNVNKLETPGRGSIKYDFITCESCERVFIAKITLNPTIHTAVIQGE